MDNFNLNEYLDNESQLWYDTHELEQTGEDDELD